MFAIFDFSPTFTSSFAFFMVFDVLTSSLSIKRLFQISSTATSCLEDISNRDFITTSNTYVIAEILCVAYFNSLSICTHYGRRGYWRYMVKRGGGNRRTWENHQSKMGDYYPATSRDPRKRDMCCFEGIR